ncbi:MAG TPA: response regulator [Candidatus Saccharimonadales bacterium]|nr:response regulator [Candidatus Saccharimonadales bacterium]
MEYAGPKADVARKVFRKVGMISQAASGSYEPSGAGAGMQMTAGRGGPLRILHLEDNPKDSAIVQAMLEAEGLRCQIQKAKNREEFQSALTKQTFDLIISDFSLPSYDGLAALAHVRENSGAVPFILFSGTIGEEVAIESLKKGATDYVLKQRPERLIAAVRRAIQESVQRTERHKAEEQIRDQAALLDKANDAICVMGLDRTILYWNKGAERMYGWTAEEALGKNISRLLFKPPAALPSKALELLIKNQEWQGELTQITSSGAEILVQSRWAPVVDQKGKRKSILVINTDITQKRKLEVQFQRGQRLENIGMLASGIAHDLNNVLAPMIMALPLLREQEKDLGKQKMLEALDESAQRGKGLVQQILTFARGAETEKQIIKAKPLILDLEKIVQETFPKSIQFRKEVQPDLWSVEMNNIQLHQVLLNLAVNARDAMKAGGTLTVSGLNVMINEAGNDNRFERKPGSYLLLSVQDTGTGMPPEVLNNIFEPFFTTKAAEGGTGLGLSTVAKIVKDAGGFMEVKSEVGKGTCFRLYLPALISTVKPSEAAQRELPPGNGEVILLVDDEAAIRQIMKATLETFGYVVCTAEDGMQALSIYSREKDKISLVATDMEMPFMNGPALIAALRKMNPHVKVVVISGLEQPMSVTSRGAAEPFRFLQKPYSTEQLLKALSETLRGELQAAA